MSPSQTAPWPIWVRHTVTAALSGGTVLVGVVLAFGDVRSAASQAKTATDIVVPKVTVLETKMNGVERDLGEIKADIKELLRRK